jgi:hypothetical protein
MAVRNVFRVPAIAPAIKTVSTHLSLRVYNGRSRIGGHQAADPN